MSRNQQQDHEGLQVVPAGLEVAGQDSPETIRDVNFQPYSADTAYGGSQKSDGFPKEHDAVNTPESPPPEFRTYDENKREDHDTLPPASPTAPPPKKRVCGLKKRTFWILLILLLLAVIALAVGLGVGLSNKSSSSPSPSNTTTPTSTSAVSSSATSAVAIPSPTGEFCIAGTGPDNFLGLCSFSCNYAYCPQPCTCTSYSANRVPAPPVSNTPGYPLPGEGVDYVGLCNFTCNHGYCPEAACTTIVTTGSGSSSAASSMSSGSSAAGSPSSNANQETQRPTSTVVVASSSGTATSTVIV